MDFFTFDAVAGTTVKVDFAITGTYPWTEYPFTHSLYFVCGQDTLAPGIGEILGTEARAGTTP